MRAIRSARTSSEDLLAKLIWHAGYRYRRNDKTVFGKPDLTFKKYKVAVFCDGEFWHGKDWAKKKKKISQNQGYWIPKIERNMQRDKLVGQKLREERWQVIRFWQRSQLQLRSLITTHMENADDQNSLIDQRIHYEEWEGTQGELPDPII